MKFYFLAVLKEFGLVGVHIDPDKVAEEMDALPEVIQDAKDHWDTEVRWCFVGISLSGLVC